MYTWPCVTLTAGTSPASRCWSVVRRGPRPGPARRSRGRRGLARDRGPRWRCGSGGGCSQQRRLSVRLAGCASTSQSLTGRPTGPATTSGSRSASSTTVLAWWSVSRCRWCSCASSAPSELDAAAWRSSRGAATSWVVCSRRSSTRTPYVRRLSDSTCRPTSPSRGWTDATSSTSSTNSDSPCRSS